MSDKQTVDVFSDGEGRLALPVEGFTRIFRPTGCRLDPIEGFPVVWQYTTADGRRGAVLNVPGFLNGGAMSIASRGWIYETERERAHLALFLPGSPKRLRLAEAGAKVLAPGSSRAPLFPELWPKEAVLRVVHVRFRGTLVVLNTAFLLERVPHLPPPAPLPSLPIASPAPQPPDPPPPDAAQPPGPPEP